jgi:uncharacterized protein YeaO (DUF488 family)
MPPPDVDSMIFTRRWDDPPAPGEPGDATRILVTRYRPRGVTKAGETWSEWLPDLGPSRELHAAAYGKGGGSPLPWPGYRARYLAEQRGNAERVADLAKRVRAGERITLMCSSQCDRESRCHRSILKELIAAEMARQGA